MRIAYVANYQGPTLLKMRPVVLNRSLANTIKLELIAGMLQSRLHEVEVLSQGEVADHRLRFYKSCRELQPFHPHIPVYYASVLRIKRLEPLWSSLRMFQLLRARHRASPFDLVIIWNLKHSQLVCADYAIRRLEIPVILEYEDDAFVTIGGKPARNSVGHRAYTNRILQSISGCIACSPWLLRQVPSGMPKLLLRGVVGADIVAGSEQNRYAKKNWVLFSGTHSKQYGIELLLSAWGKIELPEWELHITGEGEQTATLRKQAESNPSILFHGFVSRQELVSLMCAAKICINPHELSDTPGNVFAFKIIEYLAAGAHVITTPMGVVEEEIERGITYIPDNNPETITAVLKQVIIARKWEQSVQQFICDTYGPAAVAKSLDGLIMQVVEGKRDFFDDRCKETADQN
jgi:glycosyltransferase involved in cell wall biosynthesis